MMKTYHHYFGEYPFPEDGYKLIRRRTPGWSTRPQ